MEKRGKIKISSENMMPIIKKWLYSDKDIFLRELVANAADAIDKARFEGLTEPAHNREWAIRIEPDKDNKTLFPKRIFRFISEFIRIFVHKSNAFEKSGSKRMVYNQLFLRKEENTVMFSSISNYLEKRGCTKMDKGTKNMTPLQCATVRHDSCPAVAHCSFSLTTDDMHLTYCLRHTTYRMAYANLQLCVNKKFSVVRQNEQIN